MSKDELGKKSYQCLSAGVTIRAGHFACRLRVRGNVHRSLRILARFCGNRDCILVRQSCAGPDRISPGRASLAGKSEEHEVYKTKAATSSPRRRSPKHNHLGVPGARHSATP